MNQQQAEQAARDWYCERVEVPPASVYTHADQDRFVVGWWYVTVWSNRSPIVYGIEVSPEGEIRPMEAS